MQPNRPEPRPRPPEVELALPFTGRWQVRNSPARRVPSHGTELFGVRYAIDFVAVDAHHRTAPFRDWRTLLATEPPERYVAFGRPLLAPANGTVVAVHDGEPDHAGRRSPLALIPYALGQPGRLRHGVTALAGNRLVLALDASDAYVTLAHLRAGSLRVAVGDRVRRGEHLADCGNSGNSTQPHVHLQANDGADPTVARALPLVFRAHRTWLRGAGTPQVLDRGLPAERSVVEPLAPTD